MSRLLMRVCFALGCLWLPSVAEAQTETIEYYGADAIGSLRIVSDPTGDVLARQDYGPFGIQVLPGTALPPESFGANAADNEVNQGYFYTRQYQERTGRFAEADAVFDGIFEPQRLNRYAYAVNNPTAFVDPEGLDPFAGVPNLCMYTMCVGVTPVDSSNRPYAIWQWVLENNRNNPYFSNGYYSSGRTGGSGPITGTSPSPLPPTTTPPPSPPAPPTLPPNPGPPDNPASPGFAWLPKMCGGGGFAYAGLGGEFGNVHGEMLGLLEYDTTLGGAHGGLAGGGVGNYTGGVESMRTWNDWQVHTAPIGLGGIEVPGASRFFGESVNVKHGDVGGLAQYENRSLSVGFYGGATFKSGRAIGGGWYFTFSWSGC